MPIFKKNQWVLLRVGAEAIRQSSVVLQDRDPWIVSYPICGRYKGMDEGFAYVGQIPKKYNRLLKIEDMEPIEAIDARIVNFKWEFEHARLEWEYRKKMKEIEPTRYVTEKPRINWDESWDGLLLDRIQKLRDAGFEVTDFWRKQKIKMRKPKDMSHGEIVTKIIAAVGDEFTGVTFKPGVSVWWGATTRKWW